MAGSAVTASGERSVAVGGSVYGPIVTGDNVSIVIREGGDAGTLIDSLGLRRRPRAKARRTPLDVRPPPFDDCVGRDEEAARLFWAGEARALNVVGEALVGKTYLVRAALAGLVEPPARDGVVALYGGGRGLDDLLQALWEAFFESRPPSVPSRSQLERDLADREALVVVDSAELEHGEAQALAAVLPRSRLVLVSRARRWYDGDETVVRGLREEDALALLERELGTSLDGAERDAGLAICRALGLHPLRIRQAGALVRSGGATLAGLAKEVESPEPVRAVAAQAVAAASEEERGVLAALAAFDGEQVSAGLVDAVAGAGSGAHAAALAERHLLVTGSPTYGLPGDVRETLDPGLRGRAAGRAVDRLAGLAAERPSALTDDAPALVALLAHTAREGSDGDVIRLGRAVVPTLARARRLGAWGTAAAAVETAARSAKDSDALGWALHEAGTHAVARDDLRAGRELLGQALDLRLRLGDTAGAAASRHNLRALQPPWYLARVLHVPVIALLGVVLLLAAGGGAAWLLTRDDGDQVAVTTRATTIPPVTTGTTTAGTTTAGTTTAGTTTEPEPVLVDVVLTGSGTGGVTSDPAGIACPGTCELELDGPGEVVLTAAPDDGSVFADWGFAQCLDPGEPCSFRADASTTVTPRFEPAVSLTVGVSGSTGEVAIEPPGAVCDGTCTEELPLGSDVTLTASEREGSAFVGWSGGECTPDPTCTLHLDSSTKIAAEFAGPYMLTVTVEGPDGNSVTSTPAGIDCPGTCETPFRDGTTVTLEPVEAGDGSFFSAWSGDCEGSSECVVTLDGPRSVTARFNSPIG